jgi:excisionase family DNA binding protein
MLSELIKVDSPQDWLSLSQAAEQLGVHPTTLRRWADEGHIQYLLTPGGHRRFARADVEAFAQQSRQVNATGRKGIEQLWAERAMVHARQGLAEQYQSRWLQAYDEEHRDQERTLGRRLMGVVLQYLGSSGGDTQGLLDEARALGRDYASNAMKHHLPMVAALEAAMFFRDAMVEVAVQLPQSAHLPADAHTSLLRKINTILNTVQLSIAQVYEEANSK